MTLTRSKLLKISRFSLFLLIIFVIVTYAIWRSSDYARGPTIIIFEPENGYGTSSNVIIISGQAERINNLFLNGQNITIDERGNFRETIGLFPGVNIVSIVARDKFGRSTETRLQIVGKQEDYFIPRAL